MAELEIKATPGMHARMLAVIGTAAVLSAYLMFLIAGGGSDLFTPRAFLTGYMPDATGLVTGSEVRLNGIKIGEVRRVELSGLLDPQRAIEVRMRVLSRFLKNIPIDSVTDISTDTLVGYQFVEIEAGKSPVPMREDGVLQSEPIKQAVNRADLIKALQDDLTQFDQILTQITSPETRFGKFLTGEAEYNQVLTRIEGFDQAIHRFLTPKTQLGQAFYSLQAYNAVHDPLVRLDNTLASIQRGEGAAGRLFASDDQYNQILRELSNLRSALADVNAGKGRLGALASDEASYERIRRLLAATNSAIASLNTGDGQTGRLLLSPQLYESLNGSLREVDRLLRDLSEHPNKYLRYKPF